MVDTPPIPPSSPPKIAPLTTTITGIGQQQNPPQWNLPQGSVLNGNITAVNPDGTIRIETNAVQLLVRAQLQLPNNAQVSLRLEQPLTNDSMPHIRILTVDGRPALQLAQQQNAQQQSPSSSPLPTSQAAQAAELAKPVGLLLEIAARPAAAAPVNTGKDAPDATAKATAGNIRPTAAQVDLSPLQTLPAVLVRPLITPETLKLLPQLSLTMATAEEAVSPQPMPANALTPAALRPGLQIQVRVLDTQLPQIPTQPGANVPQTPVVSTPAAPSPPSAAATPQAPLAGSQPIAAQPAALSQVVPPVVGGVALPTAGSAEKSPPPDMVRAAYAAYAKQPAAFMPGTQVAATPTQPAVPAGSNATPPAPTASAVTASGVTAPGPTASAVASPPSLPAGVPLSPQAVDELLTHAETKGLPSGQMAAVVIGKEQSGSLMVHTRLGLFSLPAMPGESPPPGTVITWQVRQILPATIPSVEGAGSAPLLAQAAQFTRDGSALQELISLLQNMQVPMAAQAMQRIVPHAGANFTSSLFLFISVIRKGDVQSWLGKEVVEQLENLGKQDLLQRLTSDIGTLRQLFGDTPAAQQAAPQAAQNTNWQPVFFPVMVGRDLHEAQLYMKQNSEKEKKGGGSGTRFVVELDLSALGPMQMDGLVKLRENRTYFDLVIRTLRALPDAVHSDIYQIFDTAQKVTGMAGSLTFRHVPEFPINPLEELRVGESGGDDGSIMA